MKCEYRGDNICPYDDGAGDCEACYYYAGPRSTGATPVLAWVIEKIEKLWKSVF